MLKKTKSAHKSGLKCYFFLSKCLKNNSYIEKRMAPITTAKDNQYNKI
jgi:hypothetical protein